MLTFVIIFNLLFFILWLLVLTYNGLLDVTYLDYSLRTLGKSLIYGTIAGIIVGFLELLPYYIKKQWDLHIVVPNFLTLHLIFTLMATILFYFVESIPIRKMGNTMGFVIGGLIAMIAYIGEIKLEHRKNDDQKILE